MPPDAVNGVSGSAIAIAAGDYHSCAIQAGTGSVVCWGEDSVRWPPPDAVNGVSGTANAISAGAYHDCAIQTGTGKVVCWGANHEGQLNTPSEVNGVSGTATAVDSGGNFSCAIQAGTGKVVCWGLNHYGQATPPDAVNGVSGTATHIATGGYVSCAIQAGTGNVVCWGSDAFGEATPPDAVNGTLGTAIEVSAGLDHACAIQADTDKLVCWGLNNYDQATPPDTVNGVWGTARAVSAGQYHTLAIVAPLEVEAAGADPPTVTPSPIPAPLSEDQQDCVTEMNRSGERINQAQLEEIEICLADFQTEKLVAPMTFDDCMTADRKGRVRSAEKNAAAREGKRCEPLDVHPPFVYLNSETVSAFAVEGALALTYKIFGGPPVLDASLVKRADNEETARCQLEMLVRANTLENTVVEEINNAKREALRYKAVDGDSTLETKSRAVQSTLLWNEKINRAESMLVKEVDTKCSVSQAPPDTIFPGGCAEGGASLNEVEDCVIAAARCQACLTINAVDDLKANCDQADDQTANGSCP
jgi:hypothetical protein